MSDSSQTPIPLIEQLRAWFHPKDRSVQLAPDCWAFMHPTTILPVDSLTRMPLSLVGVAETTLTASVTSVTFANIPQTFRHLLFVIQARTDQASTVDTIYWQANGDGGANYSHHNVAGNNNLASGSSGIAGATAGRIAACDAANSGSGNFGDWGGCVAIFPNYRSTTFHKQAWSFGGNVGTPTAATMYVAVYNSVWRAAAIVAITRLTFHPNTGPNFVAGSKFALYGVL